MHSNTLWGLFSYKIVAEVSKEGGSRKVVVLELKNMICSRRRRRACCLYELNLHQCNTLAFLYSCISFNNH